MYWFLAQVLIKLAFAEVHIASPETTFMSRPDLLVPTFNISIYNSNYITPGYWFLAPSGSSQPGAYIYDNQGDLVWSGYSEIVGQQIYDFKAVNFNESTYLSFFKGTWGHGRGLGRGFIMDNSYQLRKTVKPGLGRHGSDVHEFNIVPKGQTALLTIYESKQYDLSAFSVTTEIGWIIESIFQDVDISTGEVLFEWRSLDHVPPFLSFLLPQFAELWSGLSAFSAWDYFHINSVDKNSDGDYLVSSRHTNCLYKISGTDGSIIWRLGGKNSSFELVDFNFSSQHNARFQSQNSTTTIISVFDNGSNGFNSTASYSSGLIIALDHTTYPGTATLLNRYSSPDRLLSSSMGNIQILANKNAFIGWGSQPYLSEHTPDGSCVLKAQFISSQAASYRAYKYNFTSFPTDVPAIWTYALDISSPTAFYVSWNGATNVESWNFYGSNTLTGVATLIGNSAKSGFETKFMSSKYYPYGFAEALGWGGTSMGRSKIVSTFRPSLSLSISNKPDLQVQNELIVEANTWTARRIFLLFFVSISFVGLLAWIFFSLRANIKRKYRFYIKIPLEELSLSHL